MCIYVVVCFDAKINFDDNAKFRQKEIFAQEDSSENDPREVEAVKHNLNYIGMTGNIGCLGTYVHCICSRIAKPLDIFSSDEHKFCMCVWFEN